MPRVCVRCAVFKKDLKGWKVRCLNRRTTTTIYFTHNSLNSKIRDLSFGKEKNWMARNIQYCWHSSKKKEPTKVFRE